MPNIVTRHDRVLRRSHRISRYSHEPLIASKKAAGLDTRRVTLLLPHRGRHSTGHDPDDSRVESQRRARLAPITRILARSCSKASSAMPRAWAMCRRRDLAGSDPGSAATSPSSICKASMSSCRVLQRENLARHKASGIGVPYSRRASFARINSGDTPAQSARYAFFSWLQNQWVICTLPRVSVPPRLTGMMWSTDGANGSGRLRARSTGWLASRQMPHTQLSRLPISSALNDSTDPFARLRARRRWS